jgi:hypothetical protein
MEREIKERREERERGGMVAREREREKKTESEKRGERE